MTNKLAINFIGIALAFSISSSAYGREAGIPEHEKVDNINNVLDCTIRKATDAARKGLPSGPEENKKRFNSCVAATLEIDEKDIPDLSDNLAMAHFMEKYFDERTFCRRIRDQWDLELKGCSEVLKP